MTKDEILSDKDKKEISKQLRDVEARIALVNEGKEFEPIEPLQEQREELKEMVNELADIQRREQRLKTQAFITHKKHQLEELQKKIKADEDEDKYFTSKPDKQGLIKVKEGKYKVAMDMLQDELKNAKSDKEIKSIKDKITFLKENKKIYTEILRLKGIKGEVFAKNFMKKLPERMQKFSKYMGEIGNSMGEIGGGMGDTSGNGANDFGFGDFGGQTQQTKQTRKKSSTKRKRSAKKKTQTRKKSGRKKARGRTKRSSSSSSSDPFGGFDLGF